MTDFHRNPKDHTSQYEPIREEKECIVICEIDPWVRKLSGISVIPEAQGEGYQTDAEGINTSQDSLPLNWR
jgi:hypothetical protein